MDKLSLIRTVISIILSLSVAHLLRGLARFIQHPDRDRVYWVHILWVSYIFLLLLNFWWWEFRLEKVTEWNFISYFFVIFYIVLFYVVCAILFPDDLKDYDGFREYYFSRRKWFFGILALSFLIDIGDTLLKGADYWKSFGAEYPIRIVSHIILFLLAIKVNKEWFHGLLAAALIVYDLSWIFRFYFTL